MESKRVQAIIEKVQRGRTGSLDLGNCGLAEVPRVVWEEMPWLKRLSFSFSRIDPKTEDWMFSANEVLL